MTAARSAPAGGGARPSLARIGGTFFRVGLFTFGGGYAMLPMLEREVVERHGWAQPDEMPEIFALAQMAPGVIAINTAVFIGRRLAGWPGAAAAGLGMIAPSILVITILAAGFAGARPPPPLAHAFHGVKAAVVGLVAAAAVRIVRSACRDRFSTALAVCAFALGLAGAHPVAVIAAGAAAGWLWHRRRDRAPAPAEDTT